MYFLLLPVTMFPSSLSDHRNIQHSWSANISSFWAVDWKWRSCGWLFVTWYSSSQSDSSLQRTSHCLPWARAAGGYQLERKHWLSSVSILVVLQLQLFLENCLTYCDVLGVGFTFVFRLLSVVLLTRFSLPFIVILVVKFVVETGAC
jgi:hypothetical protein